MTGCFVKNSGSRKHEQEGVSGLRADVRHINRLRNGEKNQRGDQKPGYQSLKTRALGVLPADLNLRDQVGPTFDQVFTSADDNKLVVPQFLTRYGLQSYFVKQRDELVELTAMDSRGT